MPVVLKPFNVRYTRLGVGKNPTLLCPAHQVAMPVVLKPFNVRYTRLGVGKNPTLLCPAHQVAMPGVLKPFNVCFQLLEHVDKTRRGRHSLLHAETQTVGLLRAVVRVLTQDNDLDLPNVTHLGPAEHLMRRRVHCSLLTLTLDKLAQLKRGEINSTMKKTIPMMKSSNQVKW